MTDQKISSEPESEEKCEDQSAQSLAIALEELRMLQTIIGNQEGLFDKIRGWCMTLIGAISLAYISGDFDIAAMPFVILSSAIIGFFALTETVHRVAHARAMTRAGEVEEAVVARGRGYDGPKIRNTLRQDIDLKSLKESSHKARFWVVWGALFLIVLVVSTFK